MPLTKDLQDKKDRAKQVDLIDYIRQCGIPYEKTGNTYSLKNHDSLKIFPGTNSWYQYSNDRGGDVIDFVMKVQGKSFMEALDILTGEKRNEFTKFEKKYDGEPAEKPFVLPEKAANNNMAYAYLTKSRGIDPDMVREFLDKGDIYQSVKRITGVQTYTLNNVVFVGRDDNGNPANAFQRSVKTEGKVFKGDAEGSKKEFSFCIPASVPSSVLTVCEAPIDALSYATLQKIKGADYTNEHILSLNGVTGTSIGHYLKRYPDIQVVNLCLDNDEAGRKKTEKLTTALSERGYTVLITSPKGKDINDELMMFRNKEKIEQNRLPEQHEDCKRVDKYLNDCGIHPDVIELFKERNQLYQSIKSITAKEKTFNIPVAVFTNSSQTYAAEASFNPYKGIHTKDIIDNSGENDIPAVYIRGTKNSAALHLFNEPISMMAHLSDSKRNGHDLNGHYMLMPKKETLETALDKILEQNPEIKNIEAVFDKQTYVQKETGKEINTTDYSIEAVLNISQKHKSPDGTLKYNFKSSVSEVPRHETYRKEFGTPPKPKQEEISESNMFSFNRLPDSQTHANSRTLSRM